MNELALSYRDRLNDLHSQNVACDDEIKGSVLRKLNLTRSVGILLNAAKAELRQDDWRTLQSELNFGPAREQSIQTYLDFARKNPEEITDIQEGMRSLQSSMQVTGLLPFPDGHGPQVVHQPNIFSWLSKTLTSVRSERNKRLSREPMEEWSPEALENFIAIAQPEHHELGRLIEQAESIRQKAA